LYLNQLDSCATVTKLVTFYVDQHNTHLPHSAFKGQMPDEMYDSTGAEVPSQLELAQKTARAARRETNLAVSCRTCCGNRRCAIAIDGVRNELIQHGRRIKNLTSGNPTVSRSARTAENRRKNEKSSDKF